MINFDFEKKCYSCGACQTICPKDAITMSNNCLPTVGEACVNCGLCEKVCPYLNEVKYKMHITGRGYVGRNKNAEIRKRSSSGGVFYLLAEEAIAQGWYVCGCVYDDRMMPRHIISKDKDMVYRMLGSKYVKSELSDALESMRVLLRCGEKVLFSGTPCQIAAVRNLYNNNDNIICVGVVCHGTIERDVWNEYLKEESKRGVITDITMRDKSRGWLNYGLKFKFSDGKEHTTYRREDGYFLKAFTDGLLERDRCLDCAYKGDQIKADILLGDAWGMDELYPDLSDQWGLSGIICISENGYEFFKRISSGLDYSEVKIEILIEKNQRIISPARVDIRHRIFRRKFKAHPNRIQEICEHFEKQTIINRIMTKLWSITGMFFR